MKIIKLYPILLLFVTMTFYGQDGRNFREKKEQIKSMKIAFITNELSLTPDEAAKFWPIFNAFEEKQNDIRREKMRSHLDRNNENSIDNLSEKDAANLLSQMENTEEELFLLRKKFTTNLKGVISSVKILKLKKAEEDFNRKLLQQYRDKRPKR
jgi:hypothetical protein